MQLTAVFPIFRARLLILKNRKILFDANDGQKLRLTREKAEASWS